MLTKSAITLLGKANNLADVRQKFNEISLECSKANLKSVEAESAAAWVDIAIKLGEIAFSLEKHHSHEVLHLLRTYILLCASTWPALQNAIAAKNHQLLADKTKIRKGIIKAEKAEEDTSEDEEETMAAKSAPNKSPDELRLERDQLDRKLIYLGNCDSIIEENGLLNKLFPHLSPAGNVKKPKGFDLVPVIPLVLHKSYYLVYCRDYFSKPLQDVMSEAQKAHDFKYGGNQPAFIQSHQLASHPSESSIGTPVSTSARQPTLTVSTPSTPVMTANNPPRLLQQTSSSSILSFIKRTPVEGQTRTNNVPPSPLSLAAHPSEQPAQIPGSITETNELSLEEFKQINNQGIVINSDETEVVPNPHTASVSDSEAKTDVAPTSPIPLSPSKSASAMPGLFHKPVTPPPADLDIAAEHEEERASLNSPFGQQTSQ
jgi:hypothetical protein